jgi:hypothetical protein
MEESLHEVLGIVLEVLRELGHPRREVDVIGKQSSLVDYVYELDEPAVAAKVHVKWKDRFRPLKLLRRNEAVGERLISKAQELRKGSLPTHPTGVTA